MKMRIGIITSDFPPKPGGISSYVVNLSYALSSLGHEIIVITQGASQDYLSVKYSEKIVVYKVPFMPIYPFHVHLRGILINKLLRQLEKNLDILHLHSPICHIPDIGLPSIITVHTPLLVDSRSIEQLDPYSIALKIFTRFFFPMERELMHKVNLVTTVTKSTAEQLLEYGLNPKNIYVLGSGVDRSLFGMKKSISYSSKICILYTGRLTYRKGLIDLIESAKYVLKERPDVFYVLTGNGPLLTSLQKKTKKLGFGEKFRFVGHVPRFELLNYYKNATVFVLPSHQEGLPISLLEAMACGLPTVVSTINSFKEIVEDHVTGLTVPPKSPKKLADAIILLLNDAVLRKKLGRAAQELVKRECTWDRVAEKTIRCYERVLRK